MKKVSPAQVARALIQLAAFVFAPSLFATVFSSIGEIYRAIIGGSFTLAGYIGRIILVAALFLATFIWGRFFCGFICSFGAMQDLLWAGGKHFPKKLRIPEKADRVLKYLTYAVPVLIAVCVWTFALTGSAVWSPWTVFGMYASPLKGFGPPAFLLSIGALLLVLIIIGSLFIERFFCKYLCPLGALFAIASRFRLFKIKKPKDKCGSCRVCTKSCSMSIPLYRGDIVESGECIDCMRCVSACPRKNVKASALPAVSGTLAVSAIAGLYGAGILPMNFVSAKSETSVEAEKETEQNNSLDENTEKVTDTEPEYYNSFEEDTESETEWETEAETEPEPEQEAEIESGAFTDGTYTGSGTGYRGETEVEVTVEGGVITDITVISYQDDYQFFSSAEQGVIADILSAQSTDVSTVSGATFSSNGIIEAVSDALGIEFTNPNSSMGRGHMH